MKPKAVVLMIISLLFSTATLVSEVALQTSLGLPTLGLATFAVTFAMFALAVEISRK